MAFRPHGFSILQVGQRRAMKMRRDDVEDKVVRGKKKEASLITHQAYFSRPYFELKYE